MLETRRRVIGQTVMVRDTQGTKFVVFNLKTQQWTDMTGILGDIENFTPSPDGKYLYYTTGGAEPKALRYRFADHQIETITSLKDLHRRSELWEYSDQCRAGWLSHFYARYRVPGNLCPKYPLALTSSSKSAYSSATGKSPRCSAKSPIRPWGPQSLCHQYGRGARRKAFRGVTRGALPGPPTGTCWFSAGGLTPCTPSFSSSISARDSVPLSPGPNNLLAVEWVAEDTLVGVSHDRAKILVFDVKTQKWSDLVPSPIPGGVINWTHSPDFKYVYYTTGGAETQAWRVRLDDHKVELMTSLKDLTRATGTYFNTRIGVAPDGSAVFTRDTGTEEIYALTVKWP